MDGALSAGEMFLKYDYAETKDLLKSFLTIVSATIALSVTFSEKITKTHEADRSVRLLMFASWIALFMALLFGGASMILIAAAAGCALYGVIPIVECGGFSIALWSWAVGLTGGIVYGLALLLLVLAARRAIMIDAKPG